MRKLLITEAQIYIYTTELFRSLSNQPIYILFYCNNQTSSSINLTWFLNINNQLNNIVSVKFEGRSTN